MGLLSDGKVRESQRLSVNRLASALGACALSFVVFSGVDAAAQSRPEDDSQLTGSSVRLQGYELQPSVSAEVGFDTNYFQGSGLEGTGTIDAQYRPTEGGTPVGGASGYFREPIVGAFRLRLTPALTLKPSGERRASTQPRIDIRANAAASYNELISARSGYADEVSAQRFISGEAALGLDFLPGRVWSGSSELEYRRSVQPVNDPALPPAYRISNFGAGASVAWKPGGGLLTWQLGYRLTYVYFEDRLYAGYDSLRHDGLLSGQWMFLPRTSLYYQGGVGALEYPNGEQVLSSGNPIFSKIGLSGLITRYLRLRVESGYKALLFDVGTDPEGVIGLAEVQYAPGGMSDGQEPSAVTGFSAVAVGYERDIQTSFLGNYVAIDRVSLKGMMALAAVLTVRAEASVDHLRRPQAFFANGAQQTPAFSEDRLRLGLGAEYRASPQLGLIASSSYTSALTDRLIPLALDQTTGDGALYYDDLGFNRFEAWFGIMWSL